MIPSALVYASMLSFFCFTVTVSFNIVGYNTSSFMLVLFVCCQYKPFFSIIIAKGIVFLSD